MSSDHGPIPEFNGLSFMTSSASSLCCSLSGEPPPSRCPGTGVDWHTDWSCSSNFSNSAMRKDATKLWFTDWSQNWLIIDKVTNI